MIKKIISLIMAAVIGMSFSAFAAPKDEVKDIFARKILSGTETVTITLKLNEGTSQEVIDSDFGKYVSSYSFENVNKFNISEDGSEILKYETTTVKAMDEEDVFTSWTEKKMNTAEPVYKVVSRTTGDVKYTVFDYVKYGMADEISKADSTFSMDSVLVAELENAGISYSGMYGDYKITYSEEQALELLPKLETILGAYIESHLLVDAEGALQNLATVPLFDKDAITKHVVCNYSGHLTKDTTELNFKFNLYDVANLLGANLDETLTKENSDTLLTVRINKLNNDINNEVEIPFPTFNVSNTIDINPRYAMGNVLYEDEINVFVNYNRVYFDVAPRIVEDRTLVPVRALANALGFADENITYDEATEDITITDGETTIKLTVGSNIAYVNGEEKTLDVPANTYDDRTLLPLRFIAEAFNCEVNWTEFTDENGIQTGGIVDIITK